MKTLAVALAVPLLLLALLVAAWWRNDWDLDAAAAIGDASGPIVGIASLVAIAAALWSVEQQRESIRLQIQALRIQEEEMSAQRKDFESELGLQREALELQRALSESERQAHRRRTLLDVYVPFFAAHTRWLDAIGHYSRDLREAPEANRSTRQGWSRPCDEAYEHVTRMLSGIRLVDSRRLEMALKVAVQIPLEPAVDTPEWQRRHLTEIELHRLERLVHALEYQKELHEEFAGVAGCDVDELLDARRALDAARAGRGAAQSNDG